MIESIESSTADGSLPSRSLEEASLVLFGAIQTGFRNKQVLDGSSAAATDGEISILPEVRLASLNIKAYSAYS